MKRPLESATSASPFPVSQRLRGRFLLYGNVCVDCAFQVASFPKEDSTHRAKSFVRKLGGNGANSCTVLAQLLETDETEAPKVNILSILPERQHPDAMFALSTLERSNVDTSLIQTLAAESNCDVGVPMSFVLLSEDTGARTIVSSRCGLKEMDPAHFLDVLAKSKDLCWCHFEFRQPGVPAMLDMLRSPGTPKASPLLSLEVEKPSLEVKEVLPLLHRCDVVFFSSDFMRARAKELVSEGEGDHHAAVRGLQALAAKAKATHALLICPWGSTGAFALDTVTMESFFQPSEKVEAVDSLGAGDTFIAASLYALASGASVQEALRCACAVAGGKVSQTGLHNLVKFLPCERSEK